MKTKTTSSAHLRSVSEPRGKATATPLNAITSLPPSPTDERNGRAKNYLIAMGIRMVCIIVAFLVPGWWALVPAIGAVVLPYIAVVLANAGHDGKGEVVERPGGVELYRPEASSAFPSGTESTPNMPGGYGSHWADESAYPGAAGSTWSAPANEQQPRPRPTEQRPGDEAAAREAAGRRAAAAAVRRTSESVPRQESAEPASDGDDLPKRRSPRPSSYDYPQPPARDADR